MVHNLAFIQKSGYFTMHFQKSRELIYMDNNVFIMGGEQRGINSDGGKCGENIFILFKIFLSQVPHFHQ